MQILHSKGKIIKLDYSGFSWRNIFDIFYQFNIYPTLFYQQKIVFYCHFPDQLLTKRQSILKKVYRSIIDPIEEFTTGMADKVLVNSKFTG